jgi:glycosyltransferase involved in cell wall biosynthesis
MDALEVTLVIPTIPERSLLLERAMRSAERQTHPFTKIIVEHAGPEDDAAITRQRGLGRVKTEWVTFLDDDDELEPSHLFWLTNTQQSTEADIVYTWFRPYENDEPVPERPGMLQLNGHTALGSPWSRMHKDELIAGRWCFHLTALFRTQMLLDIGGFQAPGRGKGMTYLSEDLDIEQRLVEAGARVAHCPQRTWRWHWWDGRTMGQPANLR